MKRKLFTSFLVCTLAFMTFTGCNIENRKFSYALLKYTNWYEDLYHNCYNVRDGQSKYKNIDSAHKKAFDSAFNDIEILGARLCLPMQVSELPDKFELSDSYLEYIPLSEEEPRGTVLDNGMKTYSLVVYYDGEISVASVRVVCEKNQSIDEGMIYELDFTFLNVQRIMLGGKIDVRENDIDDIKEFLGEGNTFYDDSILYQIYTDGNRVIELAYSIYDDNSEPQLITGYIKILGY